MLKKPQNDWEKNPQKKHKMASNNLSGIMQISRSPKIQNIILDFETFNFWNSTGVSR